MPRSRYVSISVTPEARDVLHRAITELTTPSGRRLAVSEVLIETVNAALAHGKPEVVAALKARTVRQVASP